jgi:hypothetical protein
MKRISLAALLLICGLGVFAQAVKDRNVIPVAVSLNQVLRMTVTNGGNIEFVFNTIEDYKNGISSQTLTSSSANPATSGSMYKTDFTVSSSTRWALTYGTEEATFLGTDYPNTAFALDNVGFSITNLGSNLFEGAALAKGTTAGASLFSVPTANATQVAALQTYPVKLIEDNNTANANAGDAADNSFTLNWRCGTAEQGTVVPMNAIKIIDQNPSPTPDRYVVNVLFDLAID